MKILISKTKISDPELFIRRLGYGRIVNRRANEVSYARRLRRELYPRFHVYIEDKGDSWSFNLHLDQRATVYEGATAHSGDYDGPVVEAEWKRILFQVHTLDKI